MEPSSEIELTLATRECAACADEAGQLATECATCGQVLDEDPPVAQLPPTRWGSILRVLGIATLIGLLALAAAYGIVALVQSLDPHRQQVVADMQPVVAAIERYREDMMIAPANLDALWKRKSVFFGDLLWDGPYLDPTEGKDRWGNPYVIDSGVFETTLTSYGAGGAAGGSGKAADVSLSFTLGLTYGTMADSSLVGVKNAVAFFHRDMGRCPESLSELWIEPIEPDSGWAGPYLFAGQESAMDPWQRQLIYTRLAPARFSLTTLGADGKPGGTDEDADATYTSPERKKTQ